MHGRGKPSLKIPEGEVADCEFDLKANLCLYPVYVGFNSREPVIEARFQVAAQRSNLIYNIFPGLILLLKHPLLLLIDSQQRWYALAELLDLDQMHVSVYANDVSATFMERYLGNLS